MSLLFNTLIASPSSKTLMSETFNASTTWVAPAGVTQLLSAVGKGAAGGAGSSTPGSSTVVLISYHSSGSAGSGSITWDNVQGIAESVASDLNSTGSASYTSYLIQVYPDGSNTSNEDSVSRSGVIPGSAYVTTTGGWQSSGHISSSGSSVVHYSSGSAGSPGAASTGIGLTFPGGDPASPAPTTSFFNVPVTPGNSYPITIASGGTITITYLK